MLDGVQHRVAKIEIFIRSDENNGRFTVSRDTFSIHLHNIQESVVVMRRSVRIHSKQASHIQEPFKCSSAPREVVLEISGCLNYPGTLSL